MTLSAVMLHPDANTTDLGKLQTEDKLALALVVFFQNC